MDLPESGFRITCDAACTAFDSTLLSEKSWRATFLPRLRLRRHTLWLLLLLQSLRRSLAAYRCRFHRAQIDLVGWDRTAVVVVDCMPFSNTVSGFDKLKKTFVRY